MDLLLREGLYFRGLWEFGRQNYGKSYEAFKALGNYKDSLFKIAEILRETSQPREEFAAAYWAAYEAGDKGALPWICGIEAGYDHPRFAEVLEDVTKQLERQNPRVVGEMASLRFQSGELSEGLNFLKAGALIGDSKSRIILGDLFQYGSTEPSNLYKLMLDRDVFNLDGFPFTPELIPPASPGQELTHADVGLSEEMSKLLLWLYDEGAVAERTPGMLSRRLSVETGSQTLDRFLVIINHHKVIKYDFGYGGSTSSDLSFVFELSRYLLGFSKKPDLTVYEYLAAKYGVRDLFDEMVTGILASEDKKSRDEGLYFLETFTYSGNFSLDNAKNRIPVNFSLPSLGVLVDCIATLRFDKAEETFLKLLSEVKIGQKEASEELANLLEFIDRARFEFDFIPDRLVAIAFDSVLEMIREGNCEVFKKALNEFRPNGERPYFMDNLEYVLSGPQK